MRLRGWLACALLCACSSKSAELTQVMVVVDAQEQVRAQAEDVDIEVRSGEGDLDKWQVRLRQSITPGSGVDWPLEIALVPRSGDADRVYLVIATARNADGEAIAEVRAISGYRKGRTLTLLLLFEDSCLGKVDLCSEAQTCRSGDCVDAQVDVARLPKYERDGKGNPVVRPFWDAGSDSGSADSGPMTVSDSGQDAAADGGDAGQDSGPPPAGCSDDDDCDDGDPCNGAESCEDGMCAAGSPVECEQPDDPCQASECVNDDGEPRCELRARAEDETCAPGDESDEPSESCARDYVCKSGACEPQTVEECTAPSQCEELGGCDPEHGCIYVPKGADERCDDGDPCTENDVCSGSDGTCAGTRKDCDDGVGCTADRCSNGECSHTPDNGACSKPCQTGTCDVEMDCQYTAHVNFTSCDDGRGATTPDFCYQGACVGAARGKPTASCAVGGCGCSGFSGARDLAYVGGGYVGLIMANQVAAGFMCTGGEVGIVYDVKPEALTAYTIDSFGGGIWQGVWDIEGNYVVADSEVGILDTNARSVDWFNNYIGTAIDNTAPLNSMRGSTFHREGNLIGGSNHLWFWGDDPTTATTGRLVRCSWSNCLIDPCGDPTPSCVVEGSLGATTYAGVVAYSQFSVVSSSYGGVMAAVNFDSGTPIRRIYSDGTGKDYTPTSVERDDNSGSWAGMQRIGAGVTLAYGSGTTNLVVCDDSDMNGDPVCSAVTGLPNQSARAYFDAEQAPDGSVLMLATNCLSICTGSTAYLVVLPPNADPKVGANWKEFVLGSWSGLGGGTGQFASEVAAGGNTIMVLGSEDNVPYLWSFQP